MKVSEVAKFGATRILGESPFIASLVEVASKAASSPEKDKIGAIDWSGVRVSLNLSEAVILPVAGGIVLSMSDDPETRRDGIGVLSVGAIGALFAYYALQKQKTDEK